MTQIVPRVGCDASWRLPSRHDYALAAAGGMVGSARASAPAVRIAVRIAVRMLQSHAAVPAVPARPRSHRNRRNRQALEATDTIIAEAAVTTVTAVTAVTTVTTVIAVIAVTAVTAAWSRVARGRYPSEYIVALMLAMTMKTVDMQEKANRIAVVLTLLVRCCIRLKRRFSHMMSLGSGAATG